MDNIQAGALLIAEPFLRDLPFARSVILVCNHQEDGSMGFMLSQALGQNLHEILDDVQNPDIPVYMGGPVQLDTLHFVHQVPQYIEGGEEILPNVFWGGHFDQALDAVNSGLISSHDIRFFLGYSGWESGQLSGEMESKSWLVTTAQSKLIFDTTDSDIWAAALKTKGTNYAVLAQFPLATTLN